MDITGVLKNGASLERVHFQEKTGRGPSRAEEHGHSGYRGTYSGDVEGGAEQMWQDITVVLSFNG